MSQVHEVDCSTGTATYRPATSAEEAEIAARKAAQAERDKAHQNNAAARAQAVATLRANAASDPASAALVTVLGL